MPSLCRSALVPYSAAQMYVLVNDVAAYPAFLPGCSQSRIIEQSDTHMRAALQVAKAGVSQWFTTNNQLEVNRAISMRLLDGPFKQLTGGWQFTPLSEQACKIELSLDFTFSNKVTELAFGKIFNNLTNSMVAAFTDRAKQVYA